MAHYAVLEKLSLPTIWVRHDTIRRGVFTCAQKPTKGPA